RTRTVPQVSLYFWKDRSLGRGTSNALGFLLGVVASHQLHPAVAQNLGLDLQEIGLNGSAAADAPQQGRKPEHELALDGRSGIVVRDDGCFEGSVVSNIFE